MTSARLLADIPARKRCALPNAQQTFIVSREPVRLFPSPWHRKVHSIIHLSCFLCSGTVDLYLRFSKSTAHCSSRLNYPRKRYTAAVGLSNMELDQILTQKNPATNYGSRLNSTYHQHSQTSQPTCLHQSTPSSKIPKIPTLIPTRRHIHPHILAHLPKQPIPLLVLPL